MKQADFDFKLKISIIDFSESDQSLLYGFASQAAIALENAQLYDSLKKVNKEL